MTTNPCQLTTRSSFVTTDSSRRFQFPMLLTWVTTESSSGSDDNVVIKFRHDIVVKMTTKIFTVYTRESFIANIYELGPKWRQTIGRL